MCRHSNAEKKLCGKKPLLFSQTSNREIFFFSQMFKIFADKKIFCQKPLTTKDSLSKLHAIFPENFMLWTYIFIVF